MTDTQTGVHTPGPWEVSGIKTRLGGEPILTVGPADKWIAAVLYGNGSDADHFQAYADARLIAAAPELLIALEACHMRLQTSRDIGNAADDKALADGKAAISKARGAS